MNDEIKVSVIVITYNHKKFIRRAIDSILSQNVSFKYEILIGDDCSTDGTRDVICEYAKMYPNLIRVFYNQVNLGATRNAYNLLMQSRGEYIAACEGDDYWIETTKLEQQINFLDTHLDYVACTSKCLIVDENNSPHKKQGISWESNKNIFTLKDFNGIIIPGQVSTIVRRNFYRNKDEDFSIFYKAHTFIGDRTTTLIYLSKGKYYKFNDRLSAYRVTKNQMSNLTRIIYNSQYKFVDEFKYTLALESYATRVLNVDVNFDYYKKFLFYGAVFDFIKNPKKWKIDLIKEICNGIKDVFGLVEFLPIYVVKKLIIKSIVLYEGRDAIMKLKNKKLLFLGTAAGAVSMVNYAKEQGAYVYVTDNLNVTPLSAKYYASEVLDYSTFDIDNLVKFARSNEIDGVLCGVSENNLVKVRELCDVLGLPCYFTKEQWDLCQDKKKFRELCLKYGVPCPKEYTLSEVRDNQVSFPIIIKPVDGFAGKGITICYDSQEFEDAYKLAINESKTKSVIIEDYVIGDEITAVYTIKDGEVSLSLFRDRYPSLDHENVTSQFDACLAPSVHYEKFMLNTNEGLKKLLKGIESTMGCVFFQGIATCDNVYIFECGYRMNALCDYNNIAKGTGLNYMHMLVDYSLNGDLEEYKLCRDNPFPEEYYCIFNMTAHGGTIGELNGLEQCLNIENVIYAEFLLPVGYTVIENNSMAQSVFRAYINTKDSYSMKETINKIQSVIEVLDINGMDMLFKKFDVNRLRFVDIERSESYE